MGKLKNNNKSIVETWGPMIKKNYGVLDEDKIEWMSQVAHNQVLNEADAWPGGAQFQGAQGAMGGVYSPYNTLYNTVGIGNVRPAGKAGLTGAEQADSQLGSGDKFPALLPLALKVAAKTIGFELVNTTPMAGPAGVLPYMDYVYSGSKQPYGATPGDGKNPNPSMAYDHEAFHGVKNPELDLYGLPSAFKCTVVAEDVEARATAVAAMKDGEENTVAEAFAAAGLTVEFIGWSRIDGDPMYKVVKGEKSLAAVFGADGVAATVGGAAVKFVSPRLISMLEDSIQGFAGAGASDTDKWFGTYQDGTRLYEPMSRATGEMQYARQISLQLFTKNVTVGTIAVAAAVTQEQVTDLQKQWGLDVLKMIENACVNELSNTINRHITSRLFALGWKNHAKLIEVEGPMANLNISFAPATAGAMTKAYAIPQGELNETTNEYIHQANVALPWKFINVPANAQFENRDTLLKRLFNNFLLASNWILQRGRYGAATFAVTNITVASALQTNAQYAFSPIANNISQQGGSLYPVGTMFGMTIYVDPLMAGNDCRVLVGRKGGKDEPGTHFCPYVMADKVQIVAEGTMSPKVMIKSRYALVDCGYFPETNYLVFDVNLADIL